MPKGKGKKKKDVDWAADEHFSKDRSMIYIEHTYECPIFQVKAEEFGNYVREQVPEREFIVIRNKNGKLVPREGAFEISFAQHARTSLHQLWSGLQRGPPRRDKFPPDYDLLMPQLRSVLKKFYPDKPVGGDMDDEDML